MARNSGGGGGGAPPLGSLALLDGGLTVPKRALDRWSMGAKPPLTTLNGAITAGATTLSVKPLIGGLFPATNVPTFPQSASVNYRIIIGTEQMIVTAGQGTLTWTVIRGINGTTAACNADGLMFDALHFSQLGNSEFGARLMRALALTTI